MKLILVRGLPGSGKSTFAKAMCEGRKDYAHVEADMYFEQDGEYNFNPKDLPAAHAWCQSEVRHLLALDYNVVVSNTFTQQWEMEAYREIAAAKNAELFIITMNGNFGSVHDVPEASIAKMKARWENA